MRKFDNPPLTYTAHRILAKHIRAGHCHKILFGIGQNIKGSFVKFNILIVTPLDFTESDINI